MEFSKIGDADLSLRLVSRVFLLIFFPLIYLKSSYNF